MVRTYNRYVPQADGSFLKTRLEEPEKNTYPPPSDQDLPPIFCRRVEETGQRRLHAPQGIGQFFKNLFPRGMDTEDLIVILLLLLLSQDRGKNGNRAMLTLGAYLFL